MDVHDLFAFVINELRNSRTALPALQQQFTFSKREKKTHLSLKCNSFFSVCAFSMIVFKECIKHDYNAILIVLPWQLHSDLLNTK